MLEAIKGAEFSGKVVDSIPTREKTTGTTLDLNQMPARVQDLFEQAAKEGKLVLIDVHGPG